MKVHTPTELREMQADETFRTTSWGASVFPAFLLAYGAFVMWLLAKDGGEDSPITAGFLWSSAGLFAFLALYTLRLNFIPTFNLATNWVLKVKGHRLYVMLRDYHNTHLLDNAPVVVSFETSEIESVGQQEKRTSVPYRSGTTRDWKERRLEIRLRDPAPQEFITALMSEPERSDTGSMFHGWLRVRSKNVPSPVSYDKQTIRILWSGRSAGISPRLDRALAILGRIVPVHDKSVVDRTQSANLTDSELDNRILELCQAGNRMDAIRLLRSRRNYSLVEATQFIDEINESGSSEE